MNDQTFLQRIIDAHSMDISNPLRIWRDKENYCININGQVWSNLTLDMVISDIKQSFAIKYLEEKEV